MGWAEGLSGALPPKSNEPAQLRRDIIDELGDHLTCAMDRERQSAGDEHAARRAALARFGNPAAVARRLWLDALRGYVMTQRILLAAVLVAVVAFIGATTMAWMAFQENRAVNAALLARLESFSERPQVEPISQWCKLTVRVTKGTKDGEPAVGYSVSLQGNAINPTESIKLDEKVGESGEVTFAPILAGVYEVRSQTPWGDHMQDIEVTLLPQSDETLDIVAPASEPSEAEITFRVDWPDDLRGKDVLVSFYVNGPLPQVLGRYNWYPRAMFSQFLTLDPNDEQLIETAVRLGRALNSTDRRYHPAVEPARRHDPTLQWPAGEYHSGDIAVFVNPSDTGSESYSLLKRISPTGDDQLRFVAVAGQDNVWTLEVPEMVLESVRQYLANEDAKKDKAEGGATLGLSPQPAQPTTDEPESQDP